MSALGSSLTFISVGILALIVRLFFFEEIKKVDKSNLDRIRLNSFSLIFLASIFLIIGPLIFLAYYHEFNNPIEILIDDYMKMKIYLGTILMFLGIVSLYYKEKIFEDWKKNGYKVPNESARYRTCIISIGILLFIVGLIILVL